MDRRLIRGDRGLSAAGRGNGEGGAVSADGGCGTGAELGQRKGPVLAFVGWDVPVRHPAHAEAVRGLLQLGLQLAAVLPAANELRDGVGIGKGAAGW